MSDVTMSTGYIKVGDSYINPHSINSIEKAENPRDAKINCNSGGKENVSFIACETKPELVAKVAIQAMNTGEIIDVYA